MPQHNDLLTTAWLAFRLHLAEVKRHERDAARYREFHRPDWLDNSENHAALARYRAAKWLVRFIRLAKQAGGFVYVDKFVYVEEGP